MTGQELGEFQHDFAAAMNLKYGWILFFTKWPGLFVLAAVIFAIGATRKIILNRRRLAAMDDGPDVPGWPQDPDSTSLIRAFVQIALKPGDNLAQIEMVLKLVGFRRSFRLKIWIQTPSHTRK